MRGGGFFFGGGGEALAAAEEERGKILFRLLSFLFPPLHNAGSGFFRQIKQWGKGRDVFWVFYRLRLRWCMGATPPSQAHADREKKKKKSWNV